MHVFKHAQPALLYLVPACIGIPLFVAVIYGDIPAMFKYEDNPEKVCEDAAAQKKSQPSNDRNVTPATSVDNKKQK